MVLSKKEIGKGNHDMDVFRKIDIINANRSLELLEYADEYTKLNFIYGCFKTYEQTHRNGFGA